MNSRYEQVYHVYERTNGECLDHSLTVEEIESKIREGKINFTKHEILVLENRKDFEEQSY